MDLEINPIFQDREEFVALDINKILREAGADKPKQTRPNDATWQNNAIQYRPIGDNPWHFCDVILKTVVPASGPQEWGFVDGQQKVRELNADPSYNTYYEFRLVAILEVK